MSLVFEEALNWQVRTYKLPNFSLQASQPGLYHLLKEILLHCVLHMKSQIPEYSFTHMKLIPKVLKEQ